jgi:uncharacterized Zn finger protein
MPDLLTIYYAAVCSVQDGEVDEIEVMWQEQYDDRAVTATITIRGVITEEADAEVDE